MKRVQAVVRPEKLEAIQHTLAELGLHGLMVVDVRGHGSETSSRGEYRGAPFAVSVKHKLMIDLVVEDDEVATAVEAISQAAHTGQVGDGLIFVMDIAAVYQIRSTATGGEALRP
jgi:nitrogen regulatory protein PII